MRKRGRSRETPFSTEPAIGWRAWSLTERDGGLRLSSLTRAQDWEPGEPFRAICDRRRHSAPGRLCSCGVYAGADPEELAHLGRIAGAVVGQVSMWGNVVEHSRGVRATYAYPARLRMVCVACLADGRAAPATRLDLDPSTGRTKLAPLCERHAAGRALPGAAPVERALLSTYQVDPLADEALARIASHGGPPPRRRPVRGAVVVAAVMVLLLLGVAHVSRGDGSDPVRVAPSGPVSTERDTSGVYLPLQRSNDGVMSAIWSRVLLLSPSRFDEPRCGRRTSTGVTRLECKDPAANLFVGDVMTVRRGSRRTCGAEFSVATRAGHRIVCWRPLRVGGAGSGRTFLAQDG
jgi:hypothetical protein